MAHRLFVAGMLFLALPLHGAEPGPTARQRELTEKLLEQTSGNDLGQSVMDSVLVQMEKQFTDDAAAKGNDPASIAESKELFAAFRESVGRIDFDGTMREALIRIYAKHFTEKELADMLDFYATPTGKKSVEVMPLLLSESMQAGAEFLGPKIEQALTEAGEAHGKKYPWRRTMADMRSVATAIEAFAIDEEGYPTGDFQSLKELLVPTYLVKFPEKDMWGYGYAYQVSPDGEHYRLVSAGADSNFEWDSRRIVMNESDEFDDPRYSEHLEDDLIYADGQFVQIPVQAKPRD